MKKCILFAVFLLYFCSIYATIQFPGDMPPDRGGTPALVVSAKGTNKLKGETVMATKFYGNLMNRIEEGKQFCGEITVGTGMTEYHWSDRTPYEVIAVKDQKHVTVRRLDYKAKNPGAMDNEWELYSNPENPACDMVKVGDVWYWTVTVTAADLDAMKDQYDLFHLCVGGFDPDKIRAKGKQTKRTKANVSFGVARYYYDYEF